MAGRFSIETIFKAVDRMTAPVTRMQSRVKSMTEGVTKNFKTMDDHVSKIGGRLKTVATVGAAAGIALGTGLAWAGSAGADFEQAISRVGAVSLMSRDQIQDLEAKALELGRTTKFTATEAAAAMETMGRAGFTNAQILDGIGGILSAAAAEGADMAEVTSHVSNVLKGMGLEASETGRVADVLALASARTNSSISSLGESMKNLSPVAKQFGVGLEDAVGMVALLQDVGLDASEAGTATATMLTKLAKPSAEVEAQMREMGISFKDANGNMRPLLEVFGEMQAASNKLGGNMNKVAFFSDLVGLRGQKAALNLQDLFSDPEKGQKLTAELKNAAGSAEKMANIALDNLHGDLTLLGSAADGVKIALFQTESGPLRGIVKGMTDWIGKNQELIVGGFTEFMAGMRDNLPTIVTWIERIGKVLIVFALFALAVKAVSVALAIMNAIAALNPFVLWTYAIIAAIALIWAFWPEISSFFAKVWAIVKRVGAWIGGFFKGVAELAIGLVAFMLAPWVALAGAIIRYFSPLGAFFVWLWDGLKSGASAALDFVGGIFSTVVEKVKSVWAPIGAFFQSIWDGIASAFTSTLGWIFEKVGKAVNWLRGVGRDAMNGDLTLTGPEASAEMVSPSERTARSLSETNTTTTNKSEVTLRTAPGVKGEVTKGKKGGGGLNLAPTGGF